MPKAKGVKNKNKLNNGDLIQMLDTMNISQKTSQKNIMKNWLIIKRMLGLNIC